MRELTSKPDDTPVHRALPPFDGRCQRCGRTGGRLYHCLPDHTYEPDTDGVGVRSTRARGMPKHLALYCVPCHHVTRSQRVA